MQEFAKKDDLAGISLRHLEVFSAVVREGSYANAALDLQMSRANVKRVCDEFAKIAGRGLFSIASEKGDLAPSVFGQGVFSRLAALHQLKENGGECEAAPSGRAGFEVWCSSRIFPWRTFYGLSFAAGCFR